MNKLYDTHTRFYRIWHGIFSRLGKHKYYKNIKISDEWKNFDNFYNDMYESYCEHSKIHGIKDTTIERLDRKGNYCRENCVWATSEIQANNHSKWSLEKSLTIGAVKPANFVQEIINDVIIGKFGTKHKVELLLRLEKLQKMCKGR